METIKSEKETQCMCALKNPQVAKRRTMRMLMKNKSTAISMIQQNSDADVLPFRPPHTLSPYNSVLINGKLAGIVSYVQDEDEDSVLWTHSSGSNLQTIPLTQRSARRLCESSLRRCHHHHQTYGPLTVLLYVCVCFCHLISLPIRIFHHAPLSTAEVVVSLCLPLRTSLRPRISPCLKH